MPHPLHAQPPSTPGRRAIVLGASLGLLGPVLAPWPAAQAAMSTSDEAEVLRLLRAGGLAVAFRHAYAPGTFDPPGFTVENCASQRNLDDTGREQAKRLGAWFRRHELKPTAVRSSPWCRCLDTARLAFGQVEAWDALGSTRQGDDAQNTARRAALRQRLAAVPAGRFEVWVSHQFTLSALVGVSTSSGEGLLLRPGAGAADPPQLVARLSLD